MTQARYDAARTAYHAAAHEYEAAIYNHVGTLVRERFPTAAKANVYGTVNEDGTPVLRVVTIVDAEGKVLAAVDEPEEAWEDFIDELDTEYLDVLIDLTGDDYLGDNEIEVTA